MRKESTENIIVTGASRGIGKAIVKKMLEQGSSVLAISKNPSGLKQLKSEMDELGFDQTRLETLACDLCEPKSHLEVSKKVKSIWNQVHGLINNAAQVIYEDVEHIKIESVQTQIQLNLITPIMLSQHIAKLMENTKPQGCIINITSTLGLRPAPFTAIYSAAKAALISITKSFAMELAEKKIRVNAIAPGVIATDMVHSHPNADSLPNLHLLKRLGTPEEIADATCFLINARWTTGTVLTMDGGLLLCNP